jgi:hypothetical protein
VFILVFLKSDSNLQRPKKGSNVSRNHPCNDEEGSIAKSAEVNSSKENSFTIKGSWKTGKTNWLRLQEVYQVNFCLNVSGG